MCKLVLCCGAKSRGGETPGVVQASPLGVEIDVSTSGSVEGTFGHPEACFTHVCQIGYSDILYTFLARRLFSTPSFCLDYKQYCASCFARPKREHCRNASPTLQFCFDSIVQVVLRVPSALSNLSPSSRTSGRELSRTPSCPGPRIPSLSCAHVSAAVCRGFAAIRLHNLENFAYTRFHCRMFSVI